MDRRTAKHNQRMLVLEIFWAAIHIACLAFNVAFLIRLGGSNLHISLLASGPALVIAISTLPFAIMMERTQRRREWIVGSLCGARLLYGLFIFVPWIPGDAASVAVAIVLMLNLGVSLFSAGFLPLLAEAVPIEQRARLFATRNVVLGITVALTTFVLGRWLDAAPFPFNYQLLYTLSLVTSLLSTFYVAKMVFPARVAPPASAKRGIAWSQIARERPFVNMTLNSLIFLAPFWMSAPLLPIYFVRELGATEGWLGVYAGLVAVGAVGGSLLGQRLIDRFGARRVLLRVTFVSAICYLLIGAIPQLAVILGFAILLGVANAAVDLCHLNVLYEVCPADRRAMFLGAHTALLNVGAFVFPLLIAPIVSASSAQMLVVGLFGLRLVGALLFVFNRVDPEQETAPVTTGA